MIFRFKQELGFSGIIGIMDGTIIYLRKPHVSEEAFLTRHGTHGFNCKIVILNLVFIFQH